MSDSTPALPIASHIPLPLGTQAFNDGTIIVEDAKSENGKSSSRSHTDSIGQSSTSSWPMDVDHAANNNEILGYRSHGSVESKMSCTWSEDKENVGLGYSTLIMV